MNLIQTILHRLLAYMYILAKLTHWRHVPHSPPHPPVVPLQLRDFRRGDRSHFRKRSTWRVSLGACSTCLGPHRTCAPSLRVRECLCADPMHRWKIMLIKSSDKVVLHLMVILFIILPLLASPLGLSCADVQASRKWRKNYEFTGLIMCNVKVL